MTLKLHLFQGINCYTGIKISAGNYQNDLQTKSLCENGLICVDISANVEIKIFDSFYEKGSMFYEMFLCYCFKSINHWIRVNYFQYNYTGWPQSHAPMLIKKVTVVTFIQIQSSLQGLQMLDMFASQWHV